MPDPIQPKNPYLVFLLSILLPGSGHIYLGDRSKGVALLCMDAGMLVSVLVSRSLMTWILIGVVYLGVVIPAVRDVWKMTHGDTGVSSGSSILYVLAMLFLIGPFALPLLWQSSKFSKPAKIIWTAIVIIIALLLIGMLAVIGPFLDQLLEMTSGSTVQ